MSFIVRNQQNNWAYILIVVLLTVIVGIFILISANNTIKEINSLSQPY